MTLEAQRELITGFQTMKDFLTILLMRQNGVIIVTGQQKAAYAEQCHEHGFAPHIDFLPGPKPGSTKVEMSWKQPKVFTHGPGVIEVLKALQEKKIQVRLEDVSGWTRQQREQVMTWIKRLDAQAAGLDVEMPPQPEFLPK